MSEPTFALGDALLPSTANHGSWQQLPGLPGVEQDFGDSQVLSLWLSIFDLKSKATARHYRTQIGRFRLFLQLLHPELDDNKHLKLATEQDVVLYEMALGHKTAPNGVQPNLRLSNAQLLAHGLSKQPFAEALKKSSIDQALSVLNALYEYLRTPNGVMVAPYVTVNPIRRVRKSQNRAVQQTSRYLPLAAISAMNQCLHEAIKQAQSASDKLAVLRYERRLWIFTLLFGLWGRRDELSRLTMGSFIQKSSKEWDVKLHRKGDKVQELPVSNWVIAGLRRYRASLGLAPVWDAQDVTPAIANLRGGVIKKISPQILYLEVKELAAETADEIKRGVLAVDVDQDERDYMVQRLELCSPHWFRHSGPTIAINNETIALQLASKILGHSSVATTSQMYFHADRTKMREGLDTLAQSFSA